MAFTSSYTPGLIQQSEYFYGTPLIQPNLSGSFSGSFAGDGTNLNLASNSTIPASDPFPFTGDAQISGSLKISGSIEIDSFGDNNVIIGSGSGEVLSSGTHNIIFGNNAATSLTTGGSNLIIGHRAGKSTALNQESGNTLIGIGAGEDGTFLANYGDNTFIGYNAGKNSAAQFSTFVGSGVGQGTTSFSVAMGANGTLSCTATAAVALGYNSQTNDTNNYNVSIGTSAMRSSIGGSINEYNIAIGYQAQFTSYRNYNNIVIGAKAAYGASYLKEDIFIGHEAGYDYIGTHNVSGRNTVIGYRAGYDLGDTSAHNILIGQGVGAENVVLNNQLKIGSGSLITISGSLETGDIIFHNTASAPSFSGSFQGDGSQLTGISAGTNLTQSIFVTENGNDTTGTIGDITKPFATLESASLAATTGSTIFVYPGTYTVDANFNLAKPGINYYFYPETTVSKTTAGDMFTMPAGTVGCNIYGQGDFILGSSAGSLVQGNYQNNNYSYDFEARDISSDSSTTIVDTFTADDHVANWKFRIMSSSAGGGFNQANIYTDGILNIDCQEIITSATCIGTGNGYRGGIVKARKIKSINSFAFTAYAAGIGLTLLVDSSEGVGGDNSNCAFRFSNQGTHTIVGDTTGIQLGHGGTVNPFSGTVNHTGRCGALAIEGLSGNYNGSAVARCDAFSNGASSNGVVKFNWTPAGSATDDYLKVHEGTVLATWIGQGGGYSNTIQVTGGKLVLDGYGKDQHAFKGWSVSGGEFILAGIFDKFHQNANNYGQNQALSVSGGICKITGTINTAPHLGDPNQKLINYTGGKLILDGATLITTGSYPVFNLDQDRDVHIFSGGVNTNQTGSNGLLQASGSGYSLTNVLGGMIIEDSSVE